MGRLIILDPNDPLIVLTGLIAGFIVNPALYVGLGLSLRSESAANANAAA